MSFDAYFVVAIEFAEARDFIRQHHYTGTLPSNCYSFGLMGDGLLGVCSFGPPTYPTSPGAYAEGEPEGTVCELRRLALVQGLPTNTLSWFVSRCLTNLSAAVRVVVSHADPMAGHIGVGYQALGFHYLGQTPPSHHYEDGQGRIVHKRTPWNYAKKNGLCRDGVVDEEGAARILGLCRVGDPPKHRYFKFRGKGLVPLNTLPYPKEPERFGYIYALCDPDSIEVRYVGMTESPLRVRLSQHISGARNRPNHKSAWIRKLLQEGRRPVIRALETASVTHLPTLEVAWISLLRSWGCPLTNTAPGGEGVGSGENNPCTTLLADQVVQLRLRAEAGESNTSLAAEYGISIPSVTDIIKGRSWLSAGGPLSTTWRSNGHKGRIHTEAARANMRAAAQLKRDNPAFAAKMSGVIQQRSGLTEEIVASARDRYRSGDVSIGTLTREFGISTGALYRAITGQTWQQVPTPPVPRGTVPRGRRPKTRM